MFVSELLRFKNLQGDSNEMRHSLTDSYESGYATMVYYSSVYMKLLLPVMQ